jgi:hypothetical protein
METMETKSRFSIVSHRPWKSQTARFPHSLSPDDDRGGKVEIQKQDSHFPTAALLVVKTKTFRKEDAPERRLRRRSGSSLD